MIEPRAFHRTDFIALLLVLSVAVIVRFSAFGTTEYYDDMAELSTRAQAVITTGEIPLLGQQSGGGIPNSPIGVYIIAGMYTLSTNPLIVSGMIIALNIIGVGLLFMIGQRYGGRVVGTAAGLLYAVNPWAVFYSQRVYLQDFNTTFIIAGILLGCLGFFEGRRWAQVLFFPVFVFGVQIHLAAFALLPLIGVIVLLGWRKLRPVQTGIGIVLGTLTIVPFLLGLLSYYESDQLGSGSALVEHSLSLSGNALVHVLHFTTGIGLGAPSSQNVMDYFWGLDRFPVGLWLILLIALALGLFDLWREKQRLAILFTAWITLHLLVFSINWIAVPPYYLTAAAPGLMLVCGFGIETVWRWNGKRRILQAGLATLLGLIVISQSLYWHAFTTHLNSDLGSYTPLGYLNDIRTQLAGYEDVLLIGGEGRIHRIWTWRPLLYGSAQCIREVAIAEGGIEVLPRGRFAALFAPPTSDDPGFVPFYRQGTVKDLPLRDGEIGYKAYFFDQAPNPDTPILTDLPPFQFANGVTLKGYAVRDSLVYLDWRLPAATSTDYQYSVNFLNASGDRITAHDTSFYPGRYWCAGDRAITWIDLPKPAKATRLRVGMYQLLPDNSIAGQNVSDVNGTLAPRIDLDLPASP